MYPLGSEGSLVSVVTADFDQNGTLDLALALSKENQVAVMYGVGDGSFMSPTLYDVATRPLVLNAADVNADGAVDLIAQGNTAFSVLPATQVGFGQRIDYGIISEGTLGLLATDIDGDGKLDVLIPGNGVNNTLSVYRGRGDGRFAKPMFWAAVARWASQVEILIMTGSLMSRSRAMKLRRSAYLTSPTLVMSTSPVNFGQVSVVSVGTPDVRLKNLGTENISIGGFSVSMDGQGVFGGRNGCGVSIAPGQSCVLRLTFKPTSFSEFGGVVTFSDSVTAGYHSIIVMGSGT